MKVTRRVFSFPTWNRSRFCVSVLQRTVGKCIQVQNARAQSEWSVLPFCPCNCGCWNNFVHKEPWPCSRKKLRINQFGLWERIFSAFLHVGGLLVPIVVFKFECYSFLNEIVSSKSQVNGFLTFPCLEN